MWFFQARPERGAAEKERHRYAAETSGSECCFASLLHSTKGKLQARDCLRQLFGRLLTDTSIGVDRDGNGQVCLDQSLAPRGHDCVLSTASRMGSKTTVSRARIILSGSAHDPSIPILPCKIISRCPLGPTHRQDGILGKALDLQGTTSIILRAKPSSGYVHTLLGFTWRISEPNIDEVDMLTD